jgi:hypothetical protein
MYLYVVIIELHYLIQKKGSFDKKDKTCSEAGSYEETE